MEDFAIVESDGVVISACPKLIERAFNKDIWGYYLCIENQSNEKITLMGKNWNITDECGNRFSDDTSGFKGEIPELEPGEFFEFSAEAPLSSSAVFYGSCKVALGKMIKDIKIPTFAFGGLSGRLVN